MSEEVSKSQIKRLDALLEDNPYVVILKDRIKALESKLKIAEEALAAIYKHQGICMKGIAQERLSATAFIAHQALAKIRGES